MANEYLVNSADLTAVADAIRTKGGTSDTLAFPGGFVEAVEAIQAGGGAEELKALVNRSITEFPNLEGITVIGTSVFQNCGKMRGDNFPSTVTRIEDSAFSGCSVIGFTKLNDNITYIGAYGFQNCKELSLTELPTRVGAGGWISSYAFQNCYKLAIISIPSSVGGISNSAFENCIGIQTMYFPVTITLSNLTFNGCKGLQTVTFGAKARSIASSAFNNCTALTEINVPWAEGEVANAPWGATNATINYNYTGEG